MSSAGLASKPVFLITIDTEGDNLWAHPRTITTENAKYLSRFQRLCERYGFKPTYLTDYEMAVSSEYCAFAHDLLKRHAGEVGMHLHAWNSPPIVPLTDDDYRYGTYLIEYPEALMREKVRVLTALLEDEFQVPQRSHRAGRWGFNKTYARILLENGYWVDCSVAPKMSYTTYKGDPKGKGGPDYTRFPELPYYLDLSDIGRPGESALLEAPVTIMDLRPPWAAGIPRRSLPGKLVNRICPAVAWLRPTGKNLKAMLTLVRRAAREARPCVEFILHSSELMPGGSPTFPGEHQIETLYAHLEELFGVSSQFFRGGTLAEFAESYQAVAV